ncbi:MAG TPA: C4-type zinc ribbon domain-containing protein [Dehalococcoidia bacterium]|nr:C4-type zinc ribbon domain-containing protein [Dehalococcoidia bacterium]
MVATLSMSRLSDLVRLQETDLALDTRRASLADADARLGETEVIVALRVRVDELRAIARTAEASQKDVDLEADALRAKIAPAEQKLYSGSIKNPKELADLQADIDQLKRHLSSVEDRDLEALAAAETAQGDLRAAETELAALEQAWRDEQTALHDRIDQATAEIAAFEAERLQQAAAIDPELLARYDHIRRVHQGRGVAKLDRNLCLGCRISLPVSAVNRARAGNVLVQCPNCERILYT